MFGELEINELEANENAHSINESFKESELLDKRLRRMGLDLHEEDIDKTALKQIFIDNELY